MNGAGNRRDETKPSAGRASAAGDTGGGAAGGGEYRVLKSTAITLAGAGFLAGGAPIPLHVGACRRHAGLTARRWCAGFALGLRREMRKFRELAEQRQKGGKFVGPPNFELGVRAFAYGTLLCCAGGVLAWAAIQYTFGVTNVRAHGLLPPCGPRRGHVWPL